MDYPLTDADIRAHLPGVKIIKYDEVRKHSDINELLGRDNYVIILYQMAPNWGHWTCIFRNRQGITYFDSYGKFIDEPLDVDEAKYQPGQDHTYLMQLLAESPEKIHYNDKRYQLLKSGVNTCGRHVINRIKHSYLTNSQYDDYIDRNTDRRYTPDQFVVEEIV